MSKKSFVKGLNDVLGDKKKEKDVQSNLSKKVKKEIARTFILNSELIEEIKAIAYWERRLIKEVTNEALKDYVERYKEKNGEIKSIPN